jgi:hypothetical protein
VEKIPGGGNPGDRLGVPKEELAGRGSGGGERGRQARVGEDELVNSPARRPPPSLNIPLRLDGPAPEEVDHLPYRII